MASGQGAKNDPVAAYQWFQLAKLAFYPGVTSNLAQLEAQLTPEQVQQANAWVEQWVMSHPVR